MSKTTIYSHVEYVIKKERVSIDKQDIKQLIGSISYDDLKFLRNESTRELSKVNLQDRIKFTVYLQKSYVEKFERALGWAFNRGLIQRKTRWAFTKFAIMNIIDQIINEIEKEQMAAAQTRSGMPVFNSVRDEDVRQS